MANPTIDSYAHVYGVVAFLSDGRGSNPRSAPQVKCIRMATPFFMLNSCIDMLDN